MDTITCDSSLLFFSDGRLGLLLPYETEKNEAEQRIKIEADIWR